MSRRDALLKFRRRGRAYQNGRRALVCQQIPDGKGHERQAQKKPQEYPEGQRQPPPPPRFVTTRDALLGQRLAREPLLIFVHRPHRFARGPGPARNDMAPIVAIITIKGITGAR